MTKKSAMTTKKFRAPAKTLRIERTFDASAKTLWSYWTDPEKYAKWLNPAPGYDLIIHEFDVRPGGRARFDMPQPDGNTNPLEGVFHTLTPYREIVTGEPDKSFLITVRFTPVGKKTQMTVTVKGVPPEYHEAARKGWNAGLDKLAGLLDEAATRDRAITTTRVFDAPQDVIWRMWTEPGEIAQWWGPDGFTNTIESMDVRRDGVWSFVMHGPDGRDFPNKITYVEVTRPDRLVYDHGPAPRFRTTVTFVDLGGKTKLTMRAVFATTAIRDRVAKAFGAVEGAKQTLGRLAAHLAKGVARFPGSEPLIITRVLDAPRDRVFRAYTDPEAIPEWWGPRGYTTRVDKMDVRPAGEWRYVQRDKEGKEHGFHGVYREVVPLERLVWTFEYEGTPGHVLVETTTFESMPDGRTKVTVLAAFASREDRDGMVNAGMEWGLRESMERLEELLRLEA